jgi:hypothetical protein
MVLQHGVTTWCYNMVSHVQKLLVHEAASLCSSPQMLDAVWEGIVCPQPIAVLL